MRGGAGGRGGGRVAAGGRAVVAGGRGRRALRGAPRQPTQQTSSLQEVPILDPLGTLSVPSPLAFFKGIRNDDHRHVCFPIVCYVTYQNFPLSLQVFSLKSVELKN